MRSVPRWLLVAALTAACVWLYELARSGATFLALFDTLANVAAVARSRDEGARLAARVVEAPQTATVPSKGAVASSESVYDLSPQQLATEGLSGEQIERLLEDEIASDTDPAAADELLRAFGESLGAPARSP